MRDWVFAVKTVLRPQCLEALLASLRSLYPDVPVWIADDGPEPYPDVAAPFGPVEYRVFAGDAGIGACLNALVDEIDAPFVVLLDDDFQLTTATRVEGLVGRVRAGEADLVGGAIRRMPGAQLQRFLGNFEDGGRIRGAKLPDEPIAVDVIMNFWAGRVETLRRSRWNERLKVARHVDFYRRLRRAGGRVMYDPGCVVDHWSPPCTGAYFDLRWGRMGEHRQRYLEEWGLEDRADVLT